MRRGGASPAREDRRSSPLAAASTEIEGLWLVSFEDEPETAAAAPAATDRERRAPVDAALVQQLEYELKSDQGGSAAHHRGPPGGERRADVGQRGAPVQQRGAGDLEGRAAIAQRGADHRQRPAGEQDHELEATNNDLDNLLTSTNIATLFLDTQLRIRRFTPAATRLFSLIAGGHRPARSATSRRSSPIRRCCPTPRRCCDQPITPKTEVQAHDGRWYVRQVLPYRTRDNRTEGVVITFSDVAAEALQEARLYAESIVDTVREPLLVLDGDMRVRSANQSFYYDLQVSPEETVGRSLYELGDREWDIPKLRTLLGEILPEEHVLNDFEVEHDVRIASARASCCSTRGPSLRGGGRPDLILLAIEDVTERKRAQASPAGERGPQARRGTGAAAAGRARARAAHQHHRRAGQRPGPRAQPAALGDRERGGSVRAVRAGGQGEVRASSWPCWTRHRREALRAGEHRRAPAQLHPEGRAAVRAGGSARDRPQSCRACWGARSSGRGSRLRLDLRTRTAADSRRPYPDRADHREPDAERDRRAFGKRPAADREIQLQTRAAKGMAELSVRDSGAGVSDAATRAACSSRSSPPSRTVSEWAWRSAAPSSRPTAAGSGWSARADGDAEPPSASRCRCCAPRRRGRGDAT